MINYQYYPKTSKLPKFLKTTIEEVFKKNANIIDSSTNEYNSNDVLELLRKDFENLKFQVEKSKSANDKIKMPVLYGINETIEKSFDADAFNEENKVVVEVEAGRAYVNNQFLKDFFEAIVMNDIDYSIIAVRNDYRGSDDFTKIMKFFDTIYSSDRFSSALKGVLLIGY